MGGGFGLFMRVRGEFAWEEILDKTLRDADFGDGALEDSEKQRNEAQEHQLLLDFLQGFVEGLLVLVLQKNSGAVEKTLRRQRKTHDNNANSCHNPCGGVL